MCSGIVNEEVISLLKLRKFTVDGKLVIVFAKGTYHIVDLVCGSIFFTENGDMMICTVHGRSHKVNCAGVNSGVLLVGVLEVDDLCDESAVRTCHESSHLCKDTDVSQAVWNQYLVKNLMYTGTDDFNVIALLVGLVRYAYTAGKIDEVKLNSGLILYSHCKLKKLLCKCRIIIIGYCIGGKEGMHSEMLYTF